MRSPPGPACVVCSTCGHSSTSLLVGSTPEHPGCFKLSWIIKLGNGFEAKGHLKQEVVVVGVITRGKGHSGWLGGLVAVLWIFLLWIASCSITLQTRQDSLLSLGRRSCLGWGHTGGLSPLLGAVLWGGQCQVGSADTALCSQLQSRDSSSLFCSPPLSPVAKDFT